jgi:ankyrin repeat protein
MRKHQRLTGACLLILLSVAARPNAAGSDVADAVMRGDKTALQALLRRNADVNAPQRDGATALHWAIYHDDLEAADLLLRGGAKPDVANSAGMTPLAMDW